MLKKRGNIWWCEISIAGERHRITTRTSDRTLAEEFERSEQERLWREHKLGDQGQVLWKEISKRYLQHRDSRTARDAEILVWFARYLDPLPVKAVDATVIRELRETLLTVGTRTQDQVDELGLRPLERSTINRYMNTLKAVLTQAFRWKHLLSVPDVPMFKIKASKFLWLTKDQFQELYHRLPFHLKHAARFAVLTGLRMRSMLQLTWDRIDFQNRRAWIPGEQMKNGENFGIPLSEEAVETLQDIQALHPDYLNPTDFVFVWDHMEGETKITSPLKNCNTPAFKKAAKAIGVPALRWHDLRHTFASWGAQEGVPLIQLMHLGGWRSYQMVLRYAHLAPGHLAEAANKIGTNLTQPRKDPVDGQAPERSETSDKLAA